jgi:peptide/nickel transport system substrate-binding protein
LRETALRGAGQKRHDLNLFQPEFITIAHQRVHEHSVTADGVEGNLAEVWVGPK